MKKLIMSVALSFISVVPLMAEDYPIDLLVRDMGYTESLIVVDTVNSVKKSNEDSRAYYATKKLDDTCVKKKKVVLEPVNGFTVDEMMKLRISEASESSEMIPALLRYHKANPKSEKITKKLAATTYSLGQYKEALYWYTLTYQRNRSDVESLWNMACIADSIGEKDQSRLYLRQYIKSDPNSAWGRMAKDILNNGYQPNNMSESFDESMAKILDNNSVSTGNKKVKQNIINNSNKTESDGMIVVSGDKYEFEAFVANYKNKSKQAVKEVDTLKGNVKESKNIKESLVDKTKAGISLENAVIKENKSINKDELKKESKSTDDGVTAIAAPLGE